MIDKLNVLTIGDIIGRPGRNILFDKLQGIVDINSIDFIIVNGENSAGGFSITPGIVREFLDGGIDVITTGNHIWDKNDILEIINSQAALLRPANYPEGAPGFGYNTFNCKGVNISVINLMGRTLMQPVDCPFRKFDEIYAKIENKSNIIIVDFHAEATSEKKAMGWYLDGRASVVFGTHTHVQTSDDVILPNGTGYITDLGMTGSADSVIGMDIDASVKRFLTGLKIQHTVAEGNCRINGAIFTINSNGTTENIKRINE
jgi:2',3'-cyclic-nucleotide 2'-phosphodiesterase